MEFMDDLAGIMRNAVLNAIGTVSKLYDTCDDMEIAVQNKETYGELCNDGMLKFAK